MKSSSRFAQLAVSSLMLFLCLFLVVPQSQAQPVQPGQGSAIVPPTDPKISYSGRWEFSDPDEPWCAWQGCAITVNFEGRGVQATFDSGTLTEYIRVIIDGDVHGSQKIAITPTKSTYTIANDLSKGIHTLQIVKESYAGRNMRFYGLEVEGDGLVAPPPPSTRKIVFYGDSNLAGTSLQHEEDRGANRYTGTVFGYAGIVSRMFDAEYHNISAGGETISSMHNKIDRYDWWRPKLKWDFAEFAADVVVVNLGANDVGSPVRSIKADYHALLDDLRRYHPDAHIVLFNAWGWDADEPANYTHEVIAERGDPDMSYAIFPWLFEQWHGCEYDHGGMARVLADHLEAVMGWTAGSADVMSGYGVNGDVANGSFEQVAPFGGYGWRYFEADGVERIKDSASARDGRYYVQLSDGANIHQPNPAVAGEQVTASVWLRGENKGEKAQISIDFRGQTMFSEPVYSKTTTVELTPEWQRYSFTANAPSNPSELIFHTRLTLQADGAAVVAVDNVKMRVGQGVYGAYR